MTLTFYNTLTRTKEPFAPADPKRVGMYVCGPTVYDDAHIGNARPIIVFDLVFRLLRHTFGADAVTYVRNITDVDDKINARARDEGISIGELTARTTERFHAAIAQLGVLPPTVEPTATGHIDQMKTLIEKLVADGHAYVAEDHVLFSVSSFEAYGALSRRSTEDMIAGARVEVAPYKRDPMDFVLWKPSPRISPAGTAPGAGWAAPAGISSARRWPAHLGQTFDIHGGGIDLRFRITRTNSRNRALRMARTISRDLDAQRLPAGRGREDVEVAR
jgi:cysteinyl-tRNA synthetase